MSAEWLTLLDGCRDAGEHDCPGAGRHGDVDARCVCVCHLAPIRIPGAPWLLATRPSSFTQRPRFRNRADAETKRRDSTYELR